jgi:hypothetical protein
MGNATPPGGNGQAAGWTASSPFVQIGTGEGGTSSNTFVSTTFLGASTMPMTRSLLYLWGMHATAFYNCFTASTAPATVDAKMVPYPSGPTAGWYKASITFDGWADESQNVPPNKASVLFSDPGNSAEPSIRGFHIRNSWTFQIYGQDGAWIDDLEYSGGHYSASVPAPSGAKLSVWRMDNSSVVPSLHETNLTYAVRSAGLGNVFGSIPHANIQLAPGVIAATDDVQVTGTACTTAAAPGATCTETLTNNFGSANQETFCRFRNTPAANVGIPIVLSVNTVDTNSFTVTIGTYNGQAAGGGTLVCNTNFAF